jgi:hypothetical protein
MAEDSVRIHFVVYRDDDPALCDWWEGLPHYSKAQAAREVLAAHINGGQSDADHAPAGAHIDPDLLAETVERAVKSALPDMRRMVEAVVEEVLGRYQVGLSAAPQEDEEEEDLLGGFGLDGMFGDAALLEEEA